MVNTNKFTSVSGIARLNIKKYSTTLMQVLHVCIRRLSGNVIIIFLDCLMSIAINRIVTQKRFKNKYDS